MAVSIGEVYGLLQLKDEFTGRIGTAMQSLEAAGNKAEKIGKGMSSIGGQLSKTITLPLAALGGGVIKLATDFESSFAGVRKTVNATEEEFALLSDGLRNLSTQIPVNVNELNSITEAAGQLGIKKEALLGFTETMAKLGVSTNLSAEEAATALARLANITGLPQDQFDRLGSTIVDLGNNFATTEKDIVEFGLRIAGAGEAAGLTEPEILAIGTAMSSVGVEAEAGGTAVQKVLINMIQAVQSGDDKLAIFARTAGLSSEQFAKSFNENAAGAFTAFVEGLGAQGKQAFNTLDELNLKDQRLVRSFIALSGAGDLLAEAMKRGNSAFEANTALTREAEQRFKTFESQVTILWNRIKDVGITLGQALIPILLDVLDVLHPWLDTVSELAEKFKNLPESVKVAVLAFGAIAAAVGPLLVVIGGLVTAWGAVAAALPAVGSALAGVLSVITGPVGWIVAAVTLLAAWKPARDFFLDLAKKVFKVVRDWVEKLIDVFASWWRSTEDGRRFLANLVKVIAEDFVRGLKEGWQWVKALSSIIVLYVQRMFGMKDGVDSVVKSLKFWVDAVKILWTWIRELTTKIVDFLGGMEGVLDIFKLLNPTFAIAIDKFKDWLARAREMSDQSLDDELDKIKKSMDQVSTSTDNVSKEFDDASSKIDKAGNSVIAVKKTFDELRDAVDEGRDKIQDIKEKIASLADVSEVNIMIDFDLSSLNDKLTQNLINAIVGEEPLGFRVSPEVEVPAGFFTDVDSIGRQFATTIGDRFAELRDSILSDSGLITSAIRSIFGDNVADSVSGFVEIFTAGFSEAQHRGEGFMESLKAGWDSFKEKYSGTLNAMVAAFRATSGQSQDIMNAALTAIANFASGNYVGAFIAVAGIIIGLFSDQRRSIEEVRESFNGFVSDIVSGTNTIEASSQILTDWKELVTRDVGAAALEIENSFGKLVDAAIEDIVNLQGSLESYWDSVREITAIGEIIKTSIQGGVAATQEFGYQLDKVKDKIFEVISQMKEFMITESTSMLEGLKAAFGDFTNATARDIQFAETTVLQAFNAMIDAGMPFADAMRALGDLFTDITARGQVLGVELSEEFSRLGEVIEIMSSGPMQHAIDKLNGVGQAAQAAGNLGILTSDQFDFLGDTIRRTFNRLIAQGLTSAEALAQLAPWLQQLNDLQEQYGYELDQSTQSLIDQGIAQGVVTEKGLTTEDILIKGFERVIEALNRLIVAMGGVPVAFEGWIDAVDDAADHTHERLTDITRDAEGAGNAIDDALGDRGGGGGAGGGNTAGGAGGGGGQGGGAHGGGYQHGSQGFVNFGSESIVALHGKEEVINMNQGVSLANMVASAIQQANQQASSGNLESLLVTQISEMRDANEILMDILAANNLLNNNIGGANARMRTERR